MTAVLWAVWSVGCVLIAYGCWRAARDYRDDEPQPGPQWDADAQQWAHEPPTDPDTRPGTDGRLLADCHRIYALPEHQPKGEL